MYNARILTVNEYEIFENLYNDFCSKAASEYNFELEPLDYDGFLDAIDKDLIKCIVLYDNETPKAFLVYTTAISEAVELNIIHAIEKENFQIMAEELLLKFLDVTRTLRREKIVCYPMLGGQKELISTIAKLGFKFVGIEVLRLSIVPLDNPISSSICLKTMSRFFATSFIRRAISKDTYSVFCIKSPLLFCKKRRIA